jgi:ABC-type phosphate transport system substrate-binding protein
LRTTMKTALISGTIAFGVLASTLPAQAGTDGEKRVLAMVGSDTTTFVMEAFANAYNISPTNTDNDRIVNVAPLHSISVLSETAEASVPARAWLAAARRSWPGGVVVPADNDCKVQRVYGGEGSFDANGNGNYGDSGDRRFTAVQVDANNNATPGEAGVNGEQVQLGWVAPNGSGSGRAFALDFVNNPVGCVDLVRSSSAPGSAQRPSFDSWGFALDAIGWNYFPGNNHGVVSLTQEQLNKMYTCSATDPTRPQIATWGELSGNPADTSPIKAYRVQPGSGTGEDVAATLLGLANNNQIGLNCDSNVVTFPVVQEHDCNNVSDADKPDAVCFYGYSRWRIQARALEPDKRNGARFGAFAASASDTPLRPTAATIKEAPGRYAGTRIVYTVIPVGDAGANNFLPSFRDALEFTGVRPANGIDRNNNGNFNDPGDVAPPTGGTAAPGFVCSAGPAQKIIRTYGLVPFKLGTTDPANENYGSSYCRRNVYALGS